MRPDGARHREKRCKTNGFEHIGPFKSCTSRINPALITYLEEYVQGITGKSFRWPGIDASAEELWDGIRFEPPKPPPPVLCDECGELFASRTKLHVHIESAPAVASLLLELLSPSKQKKKAHFSKFYDDERRDA